MPHQSGIRKPQTTKGKFDNIDLRVATVRSVTPATGTPHPTVVLALDAGPLGQFTSVGQFALVKHEELLERKVIICCNLGSRAMGNHVSDALTLGTRHPASPLGEDQAIPLYAHKDAQNGDIVY
jgi:tRNA-binding protein